jgi:hypothetical protein
VLLLGGLHLAAQLGGTWKRGEGGAAG